VEDGTATVTDKGARFCYEFRTEHLRRMEVAGLVFRVRSHESCRHGGT